MKKIIYSWSNPAPPLPKKESKPSITNPDQNLTIRQIIDRHSRGMPLTVQTKQPLYYNGEFPEIQGLDLTEIAALKRAANENVKRLQKELKDKEQERYNEQQRKVQQQIEDLQQQLKDAGLAARGKVEADRPNNPIS